MRTRGATTSTRNNDGRTLKTGDAFADVTRGGPAEASSNSSEICKKEMRRRVSAKSNKDPPLDISQGGFGFESATWGGSAELPSKEPSSKGNPTGQGRRSSSRGRRNTNTVKGRPSSSDESSSPEVPKRQISSFNEDLLSSKDLSVAFPPQQTKPDAPAFTKVETSKVSLDDSFSPGTTDSATEKNHSTKPDSSAATDRRGGTSRRSNSRGRRKRPSVIEAEPGEEVRPKEDNPNKPCAQSTSSRGGRRCDSASDLGVADPSSGGNSTGQGRRSSSRGRTSTNTVKGRQGITYESATSDIPKRRNHSFDEDLLSSKNISAAFPPEKNSPDASLVLAVNKKVESSFLPGASDSTTKKKDSTKSRSRSTERRGTNTRRSGSRGGRKTPCHIEENKPEEFGSIEDTAASTLHTTQSSSTRGGRRVDSVSDLGMVDLASGGSSRGQRRRSSSRGRRSTTAVKDPPGITDESSYSGVPKRRSKSVDPDLLSSKDRPAAFPPQETEREEPLVAVTRVETSKVTLGDSFSPSEIMDSTTEKYHSTKSDSNSTERRGGRRRSSSGGRRKRPSNIEENPDEEARSKENSPTKQGVRSSSRGGRRRDAATDPSCGENASGQGRRSNSRGKRSTTSVKDPPGITDESSYSNLRKRRSRSFDSALLSSKDLPAAFPPQENGPVLPLQAVTRVATLKVSLENSFTPVTTDSTTEQIHSTKSDSNCTGRRGGRWRSSSMGERKLPSNIEEKSDEEAHSREDTPAKQGARSSSRGGRKSDSATDLGTVDPSTGETSTAHGRRSNSREKRSATAVKDTPGDEDLPSSKNLSATFPPQQTKPDVPLLAVTRLETSKASFEDSFSPGTTDSIAEKIYNTKADSNCTERRGCRGRSRSRREKKLPSNIEGKPDEETHSKEEIPTKQCARSSSRRGRISNSASDLGTADPSSGENSTGQGRRSTSRGLRSATAMKDPPGMSDESSYSEVPKRRSTSFDEDLLSSKDRPAAFPPQETEPEEPLVAVTRVETSKVSLGDSFSPSGITDSTMEKYHSTKSDSNSTERRGGRRRSSSGGRRKRPSNIEENPDEEARSKENSPTKQGVRSSSRGGRRRDAATDPSCGENASGQGRRSSSRGKCKASAKGFEKRHATKENTKQNPVRARSDSRGRRRASRACKDDSVLSADPSQIPKSPSTGLDVIRRNSSSNENNAESSLSGDGPSRSSPDVINRNTVNNPLSSSKILPGQSLTGLKKLVKSGIDSGDGSVNSASPKKSKAQAQKEEKKEVRKMMKKDKKNDAKPLAKKNDAQPLAGDSLFLPTLTPKGAEPRPGSFGALFKSSNSMNLERDVDWDAISETKEPVINQTKSKEIAIAIVQDVWAEPSTDSKGMKDKHDSSRTRTGPCPRSGREKEDETASQKDTKKQPDMSGDHSIISMEVDSIRAKASKKSKGVVVGHSSTSSSRDPAINSNDDVARSQPATSRKIKFISRNSMANDMPDNDADSSENAASTLASTRSRRSSTSKSSGCAHDILEDMFPVFLKDRK